ncbi:MULTISPECIES: hypothetical protein [Nocardia]|uniref:hypothetical protein n=1 Tax=Nocardia TaxID=1817 RepID=UPI000307A3B0|nr:MULTISPECIES: hypothetical protein [Nocardia]
MPDPRVEVVVVCDPSGETEVSVFLDGVATDCESVVIDAGRGWEWDEWREFRDATLAGPGSAACRARLIDAFDDPPGGEYVLGRDRTHWLDGVDREDWLPSRYRLTGPRALAVTVPAAPDVDAFALAYLCRHLPEGQRLIRYDRTPAADAVAAGVTTSWDTVLTAVIADTTTGEVTAHQLLYRPTPDTDTGRVRIELAHRHEIEGSNYYRRLDPRLLTPLTPITRTRARLWRAQVRRCAAPPPAATVGKDTSPQ